MQKMQASSFQTRKLVLMIACSTPFLVVPVSSFGFACISALAIRSTESFIVKHAVNMIVQHSQIMVLHA